MAGKKYRWFGLDSILVGASSITTLATVMPATFTTISDFVPQSAKFNIAEPTEQTVETEDSQEPDVITIDDALKSAEFATRNMDLTMMILGFGGATSGSDAWKAPTTSGVLREKSLRLTTKVINGYKYQIDVPRASLKAGATLSMQNKQAETGSIGFKATVMQGYTPGGTKVAPYIIRRISG